jgi:hypothetical protein
MRLYLLPVLCFVSLQALVGLADGALQDVIGAIGRPHDSSAHERLVVA